MASADDYLELCDEFSYELHDLVKSFLEKRGIDPDSAATIIFTVLSSYCAIIVQGSGGDKESFIRSLEKCYDYQVKALSK